MGESTQMSAAPADGVAAQFHFTLQAGQLMKVLQRILDLALQGQERAQTAVLKVLSMSDQAKAAEGMEHDVTLDARWGLAGFRGQPAQPVQWLATARQQHPAFRFEHVKRAPSSL